MSSIGRSYYPPLSQGRIEGGISMKEARLRREKRNKDYQRRKLAKLNSNYIADKEKIS